MLKISLIQAEMKRGDPTQSGRTGRIVGSRDPMKAMNAMDLEFASIYSRSSLIKLNLHPSLHLQLPDLAVQPALAR